MKVHVRSISVTTILVGAAALIAGCTGSTSSVAPSTTSSATASPSPTPSEPIAASESPAPAPTFTGEPAEVKLALDWTPNTNHTGFFVADELGYYRDAGISLKVLPYTNASPDVLVGADKAQVGISFQDVFSFSKAAGAKITSISAILQKTSTVISVRADSGITSPKQLDGKVYAGFGGPSEEPTMSAVIKAAGGKGEFRNVTLNTFAYDAVYSGKADFVQSFQTWDVIDAKLRGKPMKTFGLQEYGFPDRYDVILIGSDRWLANSPEVATRFVQATAKGFEYAAKNPTAAAAILIKANPGAFNEPRLVNQSAELLAKDFYLDASGKFGTQTASQWQGYTDFLTKAGLLVDDAGKPLTDKPDVSTWFTNRYLSGS